MKEKMVIAYRYKIHQYVTTLLLQFKSLHCLHFTVLYVAIYRQRKTLQFFF